MKRPLLLLMNFRCSSFGWPGEIFTIAPCFETQIEGATYEKGVGKRLAVKIRRMSLPFCFITLEFFFFATRLENIEILNVAHLQFLNVLAHLLFIFPPVLSIFSAGS
jgi:hypothetical protein